MDGKEKASHPIMLKTPDDILDARARGIITEEQGLIYFNKLMKDVFPPERLVMMLDELCRANKIHYDRFGGEYPSPDYEARKDGLDRVLKLLNLIKTDASGINIQHPTKVTFNVQYLKNKSEPYGVQDSRKKP